VIYLELFWVFCRIGAVTFGGGYAMISLIQQEVVSRSWCSSSEFADMVALSQMTPGPVALNTATYVGKITAGLPGALIATFGLIFPALCFTTLVLRFLEKVKHSQAAEPYIRGIRSAAIGLIGAAVLFFAENSLIQGELPLNWRALFQRDSWSNLNLLWQGFIIFGFILILGKKGLKPHWAILISLVLGVGLYSFFK
jgi:chromate transporter